MPNTRGRTRLTSTCLLAVAAVTGLGLAGPASAAEIRPSAGSAPSTACRPGAGGVSSASASGAARSEDHADLSASEVRAVERQLDGVSSTESARSLRLGADVPVHVHVIDGRTYRGPTQAEVRRQLEILDTAFAGGQSSQAGAAEFSFRLATFHRVRKQRWLTAGVNSWGEPDADSREMRSRLHVGGRAALNLYFSKPDKGLLGYSSFPFGGALRQDGVTVHSESLPGGAKSGYNRGDTAVHEVGHWLGLYHTFQGRCGEQNDLVADTPREDRPSYQCPVGRDTCAAPGSDPIRNFMDYSFDSCMDKFTVGQATRMHEAWQAYRAP